MKTTHLFGALSLLSLAAATPLPHEDALERRDDDADVHETVVVTEVIVQDSPSVVVYVDEEGTTLSAVTKEALTTEWRTSVIQVTQTTTATTATSSPVQVPVQQEQVAEEPETTTTSAAPAANTAATESSTSSTDSSDSETDSTSSTTTTESESDSESAATTTAAAVSTATTVVTSAGLTDFVGIVYSPYNGNYGSSSCKTAADVEEDFKSIPSKYNMIKLYGVDCNQVAIVAPIAKAYGMKLFLGIYNVADGAYKADLESMASQLGNDWSNVHTVVIGNELVSGGLSADVVVAAVNDVKSNILNGVGPYVVTVDTFATVIANPSLCECSDYSAANMHPYYDASHNAATAGEFMTEEMANVRAACPSGQDLVVTETGWPWAGETLNQAVPSKANQAIALSSIEAAVGQGYILLAAFDEYWIAPGEYDIDQYFGIYGEAPSDNATPLA